MFRRCSKCGRLFGTEAGTTRGLCSTCEGEAEAEAEARRRRNARRRRRLAADVMEALRNKGE